MAVPTQVRIAQFQGPTATDPNPANVTVSSGPGVQPKAAIFLASVVTALTNISSTGRLSIGFVCQATSNRAVSFNAENGDAAATTAVGYRCDIDTCIQIGSTSGGGSFQNEANVSTYVTDGARLSWSAGAGNTRGQAIFFFGDGVQSANTDIAGSATVGGTASISGLSFAPDVVFVASCNQAFDTDASGTPGHISFGFAARETDTQACSAICGENARNPTSAGSITRDDCVAVALTSSAGTITEGARLSVSSWNSDGVTFTTSHTNASVSVAALCLKLPNTSAWAGTPTVGSSGTGNLSFTDPNMKPQAVFSSATINANLNTVVDQRGSLCVGAAISSSEVGSTSCLHRDNQATGDAKAVVTSTRLVQLVITTGNYDWAAEYVTNDTLGFTIAVSDASGADRPTAFFVISQVYQIDADEEEDIEDGVVLHTDPSMLSSDGDLEIEDGAVLVTSGALSDQIVVNEDEQVSDGVVFYGVGYISISETETVEDKLFKSGTGYMVLSEDEQVSDTSLILIGTTLVAEEELDITDAFLEGQRTFIKRSQRGTSLFAHAEEGDVISPGAERGTTL